LRITRTQEFEIVVVVRNRLDIMAEVVRLDRAVLVTDISMHLINGIEAVLRLQSINPRTRLCS
jgi:DNA-binding NarL/FixJ family response regulator